MRLLFCVTIAFFFGFTNPQIFTSSNNYSTVFPDVKIIIHDFIPSSSKSVIVNSNSNTIKIDNLLGDTPFEKNITVETNVLSNIVLEQRYETSVSISDEGAHCDLLNWKHNYSIWQPIIYNDSSKNYFFAKYENAESGMFSDVDINDFKKYVKANCGTKYYKLIANVKSINEYPCFVVFSAFEIRLTAIHNKSKKKVVKHIIIYNPIGC